MFNGHLKLSESVAGRRRIIFHLVDATDGITPETGEAGGQPQISKNGAAWANTSATLTAIGNGRYYVELTSGELDTLGSIHFRYKSINTAEAIAGAQVVAYDPFDLNSIADALLKRDMSAVTGEAARSPLNALRAVRNKTSIAGTTLTVTKEDDATPAWTATLTTDAGATPITGVDPA